MEIRALVEGDAPVYWDLRLEALETEPFAFGKSVEEHRAEGVELMAARFREKEESKFTLGAFEGGALIGTATFVRDTGRKERHKGRIFGVYVTAAHRRKRVGYTLVEALLEKARKDPSLEQILLAVAACQQSAIELYRRFGFVIYGTEPRGMKIGSEYTDGELMVLRLR